MAMLATDAIGWVGAACLLLAYARLSSGRLAVGMRYHLLNLAGAGGLAVNGAFHQAWPSTALNLIWLGIGLIALRGDTDAEVRTSAPRPPPAVTDQHAQSRTAVGQAPPDRVQVPASDAASTTTETSLVVSWALGWFSCDEHPSRPTWSGYRKVVHGVDRRA